jgi:RecB family exonuclease
MSIEEALWLIPPVTAALPEPAAGWLAMRSARLDPADPRFHGHAGAQTPPAFAVSAVERYLDCPFKYFAVTVLRLEEEREDEATLTPLARGKFLHDVFHEFFKGWSAAGRGAVTRESIDEARAEFAAVTERLLPRLPEADRALERVRLLGSAAAAGLGDRVFRMELERPMGVVERLLEFALDGDLRLEVDACARTVRLRGTADRIDLLEDGTIRLIDYKTGRAPKGSRAVQLPIYGLAATERLGGHRGRNWELREAGYLAFGMRELFVPMGARRSDYESTITDAKRRFLRSVEGIEAGEYPPRPADLMLCDYCAYTEVCRKDYVSDD